MFTEPSLTFILGAYDGEHVRQGTVPIAGQGTGILSSLYSDDTPLISASRLGASRGCPSPPRAEPPGAPLSPGRI